MASGDRRAGEGHGELAWSWPAIVFALTLPAAVISQTLALVFLLGSFVPCCLIRDWWVKR